MMRFIGGMRRIALLLTVLSFSLGVPAAGAGVGADQVAPTATVADLGDRLLVAQWPATSTTALSYLTQRQVAVLEPASGALRPLVQGAQQPVVSPDGRDLYFVQYQLVGNTLQADVVMLSSDTLQQAWSMTVASVPRPPAQQPNLVARGIAATPDRVFVATSGGQKGDPLEIVVLDRLDGHEQTRWRFDLGRAITGASLLASADGTSLNVLTAGLGSFGPNSEPPLTLLRLALPDGHAESEAASLQGPDAGGFVYGGRPTPDGRALYKVVTDPLEPVPGVAFLDLASASVERLNVGSAASRDVDFSPREWGVSPDGQLLYLLSPLSDDVSVVDLAARRVMQTAALRHPDAAAPHHADNIWGSLRALFVSDALAKVPFSERLQVSPDGRRLYAIGARPDHNSARADGIWVIDRTTWQVEQHWLAGSEPWATVLSADGRYLIVQDPPGQRTGTLHVFDTASGSQTTVGTPLDNGLLFSLSDLYAERYGHAPQPTGDTSYP